MYKVIDSDQWDSIVIWVQFLISDGIQISALPLSIYVNRNQSSHKGTQEQRHHSQPGNPHYQSLRIYHVADTPMGRLHTFSMLNSPMGALFLWGEIGDAERLYKSSNVTWPQMTNSSTEPVHIAKIIFSLLIKNDSRTWCIGNICFLNVGGSYLYKPRIGSCCVINLDRSAVMWHLQAIQLGLCPRHTLPSKGMSA